MDRPPFDRRRRQDPGYEGPERRASLYERREEFKLLRDRVLLAVGTFGVLGIAAASVVVGVKDSAVALAALTLFGGLLGAPTIMRLDEARERKRGDA